MRAPRFLVCLVVAALLAGLAGNASADIDPASDVLPLQNVFLPYKPKVCSELSTALRNQTAATKKAGYIIKVAVIGSKGDLGGAAYLFGKPDDYAYFLSQELVSYSPDFGTSFGGNQRLLIAMPAGWGIVDATTKEEKALKQVPIPSGADANKLARVSLTAIPKLAAAAGHPVAAVKVASSCSKSGGGTSPLIFIAPIAVLLLGGLLAGSRLRPRGEA